MTCIVAIADGKNVVLGGDSAGVDGRDLRPARAALRGPPCAGRPARAA